MTYFQLLNLLLQAHREKDVVTETIVLQQLEEVEPAYADTLDAINY